MKKHNFIALVRNKKAENKYYFDFTLQDPYEHLGLEYLQASLEKFGYKVKLFDMVATEMESNYVLKEIKSIRPIIVGFSLESHSLTESMKMAKEIKQELKDIHITVGGHLATCAAVELLKDCNFFDSVVIGYGEQIIIEMAERISNSLSLEGISGIFLRYGNQIIKNTPQEFPSNIDNIPFPTRSILRCCRSQGCLPSARMITSRGCTFSCAFCTTPPFLISQNCDKWMARSPENVTDEISELISTFGTKVIIFCDDNFIGPGEFGRKRAKEIANLIIKRNLNIHFWILCRVDSFTIEDDTFLCLLKKAGLWGVSLGIESGSDSQLNAYKKQTSVAINESIVRLFKRNNIIVECGFIMFYPYVTFHELKKNAKFLYGIEESSIFRYFTDRLELYPKVGFIKDLKQRNLLIDNYRYDSIYGYEFLDPRVEDFIRILDNIKTDVKFIDEIIWDFKRLSQLIVFFVDECQNIPTMHELAEELFQIKKAFEDVESNIGKINYQEFLKYIEIIFDKKEHLKYNFVKDRHKNRLIKEIKRLIKHTKDLQKLENKLRGLEDGNLLECFFESSSYNRLCNL
ncbi:MAG: B12-binding domain-containing radical SAM protein [Candidatus Cloacimonetes bacterium]|nr:B12-binding domain-containing radical SAM protein [Candidatus Cloacimonadota bacterium]